MTDTYRRRSPLAHLKLATRQSDAAEKKSVGVRLSETTNQGLINIRGNAQDKSFQAAIKKATQLDIPRAANTVSGKPTTTRMLWLGPDEWLVITKPAGAPRMLSACRNALNTADVHAAVIDVSESRTCFSVSGSKARSVLAKGCTLDLHPSVFGPGTCAQSNLAKVGIILTQVALSRSGDATFEIYPLRSFAAYLWQWLEDASAEYGLDLTS